MTTCYVCCPAYALDGPLRRAKLLESIAPFAREFQLEVVPSPLMDRHLGQGAWLPTAERRSDILRALEHDVVWACAGGYGSAHLAEILMTTRTVKAPLLIGYSDITVLHACWRARRWGEGIYGAVPTSRHGRSGETLCALLRGDGYTRSSAVDAGVRVLRAGQAAGPCMTVCVSVFAGLCGTAAMPDLTGHVLAIEDVDEHPFQLDFALNQLHLSGALEGVVGLIGGSFTHKERSDYHGPTIDEVLAEWSHRLRIPAISRLPFGHIDDGLMMPCGRLIDLRGDERGDWSLVVSPRSR
ncbi:MAG: LD-carboxypeptidase [Planctomycetes bacterium]|nr:LD-carboxypeptidase [Planctomycetota bacterium]